MLALGKSGEGAYPYISITDHRIPRGHAISVLSHLYVVSFFFYLSLHASAAAISNVNQLISTSQILRTIAIATVTGL